MLAALRRPLCLCALLAAASAGAARPPIRHEPIPQPDRLFAAPTDAPVLVFEEGDGPSALPARITVGGRTLVAPPATVTGTGEDLLYRTAKDGGTPAPGTLQNLEGAFRPDRDTGREPWLTYHAVFDPDPIPFKRNQAKDTVRADGALVVGQPAVRPIGIAGNRIRSGAEVFYGSVLLELRANVPVPLPSISPESRILSYESVPPLDLEFGKDAADNYYVTATSTQSRVRLNFVMDAPAHWFVQSPSDDLGLDEIPPELTPDFPQGLRADVARVADAIGIVPADGFAATLAKLVFWFRSFETGALETESDDLYLDLALGKKGVCRHRVYAFVITAQGLGLPARYVTNEAHTFVEVYMPRAGWFRVDLGGGAMGMNVRNSAEKSRHTVDPNTDPFGFPSGFRGGYSHQASSEAGADASNDPSGGPRDDVRGLPEETQGAVPTQPRDGEPSEGTAERQRPGHTRKPVANVYRAARNEKRQPTATVLEGATARVFRGDSLTLRGRVITDNEPVVGAAVRVSLLDPSRTHVLYILGKTTTGVSGEFEVSVTIPDDAELGAWDLVAEFEGDARHAPSISL